MIEISNQQSLAFDETPLIEAARRILVDHDFSDVELSIAVVDDPTMRQLNKQYLDHDYETDVLSFVLDCDTQGGSLGGQLIVSADTAQRESVDAGWSMEMELLLYVIHGTLHLVGYDDKRPDDVEEMRRAEHRYLPVVARTQLNSQEDGRR